MITRYDKKSLAKMSDEEVKVKIEELLKEMNKETDHYSRCNWPLRTIYAKLYTCYRENHNYLKLWNQRKNVVTE